MWCAVLIASAIPAFCATASSPLALYQGKWKITRKDAAAGAKPDTLINECAALVEFYTCSQNVNGQQSGLLVFLPAGASGHFWTQVIRPDGRATGRDELQIDHRTWTFSSRRDEGGKTTFYRTLNTFADKDHIHFESSHSSDHKNWTTDSAGDEVRLAAGK